MPDINKTVPCMPLVGVPTCRHEIGGLAYDCSQHKYLAALYASAKVLPLQIPLFAETRAIDVLLEKVDGIMLTGSPSNIDPCHYGEQVVEPGPGLDPARDATILPLIKPAIERGIPLFAICRGIQELNVAFGGSLHPHLDRIDSRVRHAEDKNLSLDQRYAEVHGVKLVPGGQLNKMLGVTSIEVNSLHGQGIDRLGANLVVEGRAEDGLIEAVSVADSSTFAVGVQWHPEWRSTQNTISTILFSEFGKACYQYTHNGR